MLPNPFPFFQLAVLTLSLQTKKIFFLGCLPCGLPLRFPPMKNFFLLSIAAAAALFLTQGCALFNQMNSGSTEQLLVAAGFQERPANTPKRQQMMAKLNPYKVQMRTKGNSVIYIYPDPKKNVAFVGGPSQYQAYQKLSVQQSIAENQAAAAAEMEMMGVDDGTFGMGMWDPFW